ncbi:MAG: hypothetical protein EZS28_029779, partial [Streblomastix strix]
SDDFQIEAGYSLGFLAQNEENRIEILNNNFLESIAEDLKKKIQGNEVQKTSIQQKQKGECAFISTIIFENKDNNIKNAIIISGIIDALISIFEIRDLSLITNHYINLFREITFSNNEINLQIYDKQPFPGLIRLLAHENNEVVDLALSAIMIILETGSKTSPQLQQHPYYEAINACRGHEKLFTLFKRTDINEEIRENAATCICFIFRAREITNVTIRREIISYIKAKASDENMIDRHLFMGILKLLALNDVNRPEIERDCFTITG